MLSFKDLTEKKKTNVLINPKKKDLQEKNHGEDCDCMKCEQKRRKEDVNDGPDIATEESCGKGMYYCNTDQKCKPIPCLLYTSPSPRDPKTSRMPSSA